MLSPQVIVAADLILSRRFHFIVCVLMQMLRTTRVGGFELPKNNV